MKIYNVELDTKSQQELADFWCALQTEAETCKPENESASRERLLEGLKSLQESYQGYITIKKRPPVADATETEKKTQKLIMETMRDKTVRDMESYKAKLVEFRFGAAASAELQDNTTSMVLSPEETKTFSAIRKEARRKSTENALNQPRFSPYKKGGKNFIPTAHQTNTTNWTWTTPPTASVQPWTGMFQPEGPYRTPAAGHGSTSAVYRQPPPGPHNQAQFQYYQYKPHMEEKKRMSQCFVCEEFGHWAKDGVCKTADIQRVQARKHAATGNLPAIQFEGNN